MAGTVTVRLFSALRERVGEDHLEIPAAEAARLGEAMDWLAARHSAIADYRPWIRVVVNREYTTGDRELEPGDELALITPVSGG